MSDQEDFKPLADLMPPKAQLSPDSASASPESSFWTDEELSSARAFWVKRYLKAGWKLLEGTGLFTKGSGRSKVDARPTALMTGKIPFTPGFDPKRDAFAVRMGAVFVSDNRYRLGLNYVDREGTFIDPRACPGCGSIPGEIDLRFFVRVDRSREDPFKKLWEHTYTYCKVCVTRAEVEEMQRKAEAAPPPKQQRGWR